MNGGYLGIAEPVFNRIIAHVSAKYDRVAAAQGCRPATDGSREAWVSPGAPRAVLVTASAQGAILVVLGRKA